MIEVFGHDKVLQAAVNELKNFLATISEVVEDVIDCKEFRLGLIIKKSQETISKLKEKYSESVININITNKKITLIGTKGDLEKLKGEL